MKRIKAALDATAGLRPRYVREFRSASDAFLAEDFLARDIAFDFERDVQAWLRKAAAAGRVEVRDLAGPGSARAWHLRSRSGAWRPLAIRNFRDGSAYSRLTGRALVACLA